MNCKICGAPVPEGQDFCEAHASLPVVTAKGKEAVPPSSKKGIIAFVFGLGSLIPTLAGYIMSGMAVAFLAALRNGTPVVPLDGCRLLALFGFLCTQCSMAMIVLSVVLGIGAIRCFARARREGLPKPVCGLVMGIIGMAHGAFFLIYDCLGLFLSLMWGLMAIV